MESEKPSFPGRGHKHVVVREIAEAMSASIVNDVKEDNTTDAVSAAVSVISNLIEEYGADFAQLDAFCKRHDGGLSQSQARVLTKYLERFLEIEEPFSELRVDGRCHHAFERAQSQ